MAMTLEQFGQIIKQKHPEYKALSDTDVGNKVLTKYPQYHDMVTAKTEAAVPESPGILDLASKAVNKGYEAFSNAPGLKQASQLVGGVVGAGGGLIGGA